MHSVPTAKSGYGDLRGLLAGLQVFLLVIALIFCALRTYSRIVIVSRLGPDDYIMIVATVLSIGLTINASVGTIFGWGLHIVDVLPEDAGNVLLISWIAQVLFTLTTASVKISILSFYLRLANTKTYKRIIYASIAWLSAWCLAFLLTVIFQCNPVSSYWTPSFGKENPHCINASPALLVNGVTNILNDLFVYILPMPMLWQLQMPVKQRVGLLAIFGVGSIVCIAGAMRVYYSIVVNDGQDGTWTGFNLWTWEAVEVDLGIACACAPAVKPLLLRWFPRFMASVFGASSSRTANPSRAIGLPGGNGPFIPMKDSGIRVERGVTVEREQRTKDFRGKWDEESSVDTRIGRSLGKDASSEESLADHSVMAGTRIPRS